MLRCSLVSVRSGNFLVIIPHREKPNRHHAAVVREGETLNKFIPMLGFRTCLLKLCGVTEKLDVNGPSFAIVPAGEAPS
jgi:hypothetical protein